MRVVRSKEIDIISNKKVHPTVKQELGAELLMKALSLPYRLQLYAKNYVYAALQVKGKRIHRIFNYSTLGYKGAVEEAMAWVTSQMVPVKKYLGTVSLICQPLADSSAKLWRSRVNYYDASLKKWRSKSFNRILLVLTDDDRAHMLLTAQYWLDEYIKRGKEIRSYSDWSRVMKYNNDKPYIWEDDTNATKTLRFK